MPMNIGHLFYCNQKWKGGFRKVTGMSGKNFKIDRARRITLGDHTPGAIRGIKRVKNICQLKQEILGK
jgi:hypothetical protein